MHKKHLKLETKTYLGPIVLVVLCQTYFAKKETAGFLTRRTAQSPA